MTVKSTWCRHAIESLHMKLTLAAVVAAALFSVPKLKKK